jgi:hypothetical protein
LRNVEIPLPFGIDCLEVERAIDKALAQVGLQISLRDTLKKFPGCVHWHAKNGREVGTMEITLWPQEQRAWFTVQDGRKADWIGDKMELVQEEMQRQLCR